MIGLIGLTCGDPSSVRITTLPHTAHFQPFSNQAQDDRGCNTMSNNLLQPFMLDVVEVTSDVGLKQVSSLLCDNDLA